MNLTSLGHLVAEQRRARGLTLPELAATAGWRGLVSAIRAHRRGRLADRVQEVVKALDQDDPKVRAFATLLPEILRSPESGQTRRRR